MQWSLKTRVSRVRVFHCISSKKTQAGFSINRHCLFWCSRPMSRDATKFGNKSVTLQSTRNSIAFLQNWRNQNPAQTGTACFYPKLSAKRRNATKFEKRGHHMVYEFFIAFLQMAQIRPKQTPFVLDRWQEMQWNIRMKTAHNIFFSLHFLKRVQNQPKQRLFVLGQDQEMQWSCR